jgi:DNA-binding transcriptional LysR family regulator
MAALRQAAIAGVGIVQLPTMMIWQDIEAGRLVHVLSEWRPRAGIVHAVSRHVAVFCRRFALCWIFWRENALPSGSWRRMRSASLDGSA